MKSGITYRGMTLLLTLLFFVNSIGLSIDVHLCDGEVWSYSFFGKAESCKMMHGTPEKKDGHACCSKKKLPQNDGQQTDRVKKRNCCSNKVLTIQITDGFNRVEQVFHNDKPVFTSLTVLSRWSRPAFGYTIVEQLHPDPPPLKNRDRSILYQVFRI